MIEQIQGGVESMQYEYTMVNKLLTFECPCYQFSLAT